MFTASQQLTNSAITTINVIEFVASVAGLAVSVIAIWISFHFKSQSDKVNSETIRVMTDIRSDAKSIAGGVMSELTEYGKTMRMRYNTSTDSKVAQTEVEGMEFLDKMRMPAGEATCSMITPEEKKP